MTPAETHVTALREESERLLAWQRDPIKCLRDSFDALTYEQQWDVLNAEYFDPAVLREIQQEVEQ